MFAVTSFEDNIRVLPNDLTKPPLDAVTEVIEHRFINKVIADVGLVVTIYDIQSVEGGIVYPNDGAAYFKVCFRLVIFRPMEGGIIVGKLKSCNKNGLRLSLGFFDDVLVPDYALQEPSFFDDNEKLWLWKFEGQDMYLDLGQPVRFKVAAVKFAPPPTPQQLQNATGDDKLLGTVAKPYSPMEVMGDINGDGLGLTSWWGGQAEEDGGEGAEGGEQ